MNIDWKRFGKTYKFILVIFFVLTIAGLFVGYPLWLSAVIYLGFAALVCCGTAWLVGYMAYSIVDETPVELVPLGLLLTAILVFVAAAAGLYIVELVSVWFVLHKLVILIAGMLIAGVSIYVQHSSQN